MVAPRIWHRFPCQVAALAFLLLGCSTPECRWLPYDKRGPKKGPVEVYEVADVVAQIVGTVGLPQNFCIREIRVANAKASIDPDTHERVISYNSLWLTEVNRKVGTRWAATSILAHEVGHHLIGHTIDQFGSNHKSELEADQWSGFVLRKMGASLDDSLAAMREFGTDVASETHPSKAMRLRAIESGWRNAESDPSAPSSSRPTPPPPSSQSGERLGIARATLNFFGPPMTLEFDVEGRGTLDGFAMLGLPALPTRVVKLKHDQWRIDVGSGFLLTSYTVGSDGAVFLAGMPVGAVLEWWVSR